MNEQELVLVVPADELAPWLPNIDRPAPFRELASSDFPAIFHLPGITFKPRGEVETDPSFKQLIPYVICEYGPDGTIPPTLLTYWRGQAAGEARLHGKRSLGIGGHINPTGLAPSVAAFRCEMLRELAEELGTSVLHFGPELRGILYDGTNDVGRVHVGIVHWLRLPAELRPESSELTLPERSTAAQLVAQIDEFEPWSQIMIREIGKYANLLQED